jgi:hypothetical protein
MLSMPATISWMVWRKWEVLDVILNDDVLAGKQRTDQGRRYAAHGGRPVTRRSRARGAAEAANFVMGQPVETGP